MDITLKQLQIFQAVVVAGSITKASRRVRLSQPSISQQLAKLEEKLGSQLIQRNRTGVISLTPAGEYWFKAADEVLRRVDAVVVEHQQRFVDNSVSVRMGVTPTLRGRFGAAAARIASEAPGFVKFDLHFALTSAELVEQLRLHQVNYAIVSADTIAEERGFFHVAELFEDPLGWVVPVSVPQAQIQMVLNAKRCRTEICEALRNYVEMEPGVALGASSDEWYRRNLPEATATFSANTYSTAVDIVSEGLATTHSPLSLMPNVSANQRAKIRVIPIQNFSRSVVLAMPKHLQTLTPYATIFNRIVEFCQTEYNREMLMAERPVFKMVD